MSTALETLSHTATRDLLGEIVTWDLGSVELPVATVKQALTDAGLPEDSLGDLRTQTAFGRAIKDLREGRAIDKVQTDNKTGIAVFQFTRKTLDAARLSLNFAFEAKCCLDTKTGDITCSDSPEIESYARTMLARALTHRTTSDITRLVQRMFLSHADLYAINPKKGVAYFVPEEFRGFSAQIEDFLAALGGSLLRFPVPKGTEAGNRSVRDSVESGLLALSSELQEAVDAWGEKTRGSTMDNAVERWQIIKHKAEAYSEYLGDRQASLLATLAEQRRRLATRIDEVTALKAAPAVPATPKTVPQAQQADGSAQQELFSETRPAEPQAAAQEPEPVTIDGPGDDPARLKHFDEVSRVGLGLPPETEEDEPPWPKDEPLAIADRATPIVPPEPPADFDSTPLADFIPTPSSTDEQTIPDVDEEEQGSFFNPNDPQPAYYD